MRAVPQSPALPLIPSPKMAFLSILRAVVVSAVLFTSVSAKSCTKPEVRKEWRSISSEERACWIDAIQVLS